MLPNRYNVYLHGTSAPALFGGAQRAFSHGCIRVADPMALMSYVLRGDSEWSRDRIVQQWPHSVLQGHLRARRAATDFTRRAFAVAAGFGVPDPQLARDAVAALKAELPMSWEKIQPTVQDGRVSLEGTVEWHYQRDRAERAMHRLRG